MSSNGVIKMADLMPAIYTIEIETPYGEVLSVKVKDLTFHEQDKIARGVPNPEPPMLTVNGEKKPQYDDPDYRDELTEAQEEREMRLIAAALQGGGSMEQAFNEMSLEDAAQAVRGFGMHKLNGIRLGLRDALTKGQARVTTLADRFQEGHMATATDESAAGVPDSAEPVG